jgi:hypothetical protein
MTEREGWTPEEIALFDAQADHEGWSYAHKILKPWVEITREIGSDELMGVMEKALAEVEGEVNRTRDVLEPLLPSYREFLEKLAVSHGFEDAEELARRAVEQDPNFTVPKILEKPVGGFGHALEAVMPMSEEERWRLTEAFVRTFMRPLRLEQIES